MEENAEETILERWHLSKRSVFTFSRRPFSVRECPRTVWAFLPDSPSPGHRCTVVLDLTCSLLRTAPEVESGFGVQLIRSMGNGNPCNSDLGVTSQIFISVSFMVSINCRAAS